MIVDPLERCRPKASAKCVSLKGWPVGEQVIKYSKSKYGEVICFHCQKELLDVGLLKK